MVTLDLSYILQGHFKENVSFKCVQDNTIVLPGKNWLIVQFFCRLKFANYSAVLRLSKV